MNTARSALAAFALLVLGAAGCSALLVWEDAAPAPAGCGDGTVDIALGEQCDDGNNDNGDGCSFDCQFEDCGNGVVEAPEECDNGDNNSSTEPNACRLDCRLPYCGDNVPDSGEACDDGGANSDTGACTTTCQAAVCGDGLLHDGVEACDDGNAIQWDGCDPGDCTVTEIQLNDYTTQNQLGPDVAIHSDGSFVVTWSGKGQVDDWGIFARRFAADGRPIGVSFRVNINAAGDQNLQRIGMADDGSFVIVWTVWDAWADGDGAAVMARRYNPDGSVLPGGEFVVNTTTAGDQHHPDISVNGSGNFVIVYTSTSSPGVQDHLVQRFDSNGVAQGGEIDVQDTAASHTTPVWPRIAMDSQGRFGVLWTHANLNVGCSANRSKAFLRAYQADGQVASGGSPVNVSGVACDEEWGADIAMSAAGKITVFYLNFNELDPLLQSSRTREFTFAGGNPANAVFVAGPSNSIASLPVCLASSRNGRLLATRLGSPKALPVDIVADDFNLDVVSFDDAGGFVAEALSVNRWTTDRGVLIANFVMDGGCAINDAGQAVATWTTLGQDGNGWGVFGQRFNVALQAVGNGPW